MGLFSKKKTLPRSEQALAEAADLGPVELSLDGNRLIYHNGQWTAEIAQGSTSTYNQNVLEKEIQDLRREKRKLKKEIDKYVSQAQHLKELKERWNLLNFKYQLLIDMWAMRALDNERIINTGERHGQQQASPSKTNRKFNNISSNLDP